jgi:hypothetical protein
MKTILDALHETLDTLRNMSPGDYAALDDDAWQLTQDISDCCNAIHGRIMSLDALAPVPVTSIDAPLKVMHGVTCYATVEAMSQQPPHNNL